MVLEDYRRKRDFSRTPEPSGEAAPWRRQETAPAQDLPGWPGWEKLPIGRRFCVQMHRATRLHYDVRLEHGGVLLSWAVPRGPTLDPAEKHLAVHVEDHPLDYGDFEGVIPEGYGMGTVLLWDAGVVEWTRESAEDVDGSLRRGDVKFRLRGSKLGGEFALVRLGPRGRRRAPGTQQDDRNWLLIKKHDDAARERMRAADLPHSVKTGRTLDEIAAAEGGDPRQRGGRRRTLVERGGGSRSPAGKPDPPAAPFPVRLRPMLAVPLDRPFSRPGWLFELKYDGVRALATLRDGAVTLRGRRGRDETSRYPEARALTRALDAREAVLDGEIVAFDESGAPSFPRLQRRVNASDRDVERARREVPAALVLFDCLWVDGEDLTRRPLAQRKALLRRRLRDDAQVVYADHVETDGDAFFAAVVERGLEGMVAKRADSQYEPGRRSASWLKIKAWQTQDCVIGGWTEGRGSRASLGALVLGVYEGDGLVHCGQVGGGLDEAMLSRLRAALDARATDTCPFDPQPRTERSTTWARPELVCRVRFSEWTPAHTLRQPSFMGLRDDVDPRDCVRETALAAPPEGRDRAPENGRNPGPAEPWRSPAGPPQAADRPPGAEGLEDALAELSRLPAQSTWEVAGRRVKLTNLDKLLWPDDGVTKRDMIAHYVRMAPVLLPHLRDRPLGTQVFPDGIAGKSFWRKRIPGHAPDWIRTWTHRGDRTVTYIVVEEAATLAWVANSGVIDLHPWHSRVDAPERPDWAVFDLDPFPPATLAEVVDVARVVRAALDHLGLRGYPKSSGQTGLQIYVPLDRGPDYATVRRFVEQIGQAIAQVLPDRITWEWEVAKRTGRIRVDYTQNVIGKTLAAPYSLRPVPGAPVSTPVTWEELDAPGFDPASFTLHSIGSRIAARGDLFAAVLRGGQTLPSEVR